MPRLWWWHPPCLLERVIVNLRDNPDEAIDGVLWSYRGGWLVLRDASALTGGSAPTKIDGEVIVHVDRVAYFQKPHA
jgi:hypothetical protein